MTRRTQAALRECGAERVQGSTLPWSTTRDGATEYAAFDCGDPCETALVSRYALQKTSFTLLLPPDDALPWWRPSYPSVTYFAEEPGRCVIVNLAVDPSRRAYLKRTDCALPVPTQ